VNDCGFKGSELNKSERVSLNHTALLLATLAAMNLASAVYWAIEPYFLLDQKIIVEPKLKQ
jgi:hypothetical protein